MDRTLLLLGREGQVARALREQAGAAGWAVQAVGRAQADLATAELGPLLARAAPALVVNAAAYTAVDRAESEPQAAEALNADLPGRAARACAEREVPFVHISTDYVFGGGDGAPYREDDPVSALGVYGASKARGEAAVAAAGGRAAVARTSWVYGAEGANFVRTMLRLAAERDELRVVDDQRGRPTWSHDVAAACLALGEALVAGRPEAAGVFHAAGPEEMSWADLAEAALAESARRGGPTARVARITTAEFPTPAPRPRDSRLDISKLQATTPWRPTPPAESLSATVEGVLQAG